MPYMNIEASKQEVLHKLLSNRSRHRRVFEAALAGYRDKLQGELEARLTALSSGKLPDPVIHLTEPEDHTRDYDRVIAMLRMHQGDTFELDESDFNRYILDRWEWMRQWTHSNSGYAPDTFAIEYAED